MNTATHNLSETEFIGRVPPHSIEAEQALLGAMVIDRKAIERAAAILRPDDLYRESHRLLYKFILSLNERDVEVDSVTLMNEVLNWGGLEAIGGRAYITGILDTMPSYENVEHYAHIVRDKAIARNVIDAGRRIVELGFAPTEDMAELVNTVEETAYTVRRDGTGIKQRMAYELMAEMYDRSEMLSELKSNLLGISSGIGEIDRMTFGFQAPDLIVIGARPSVGKTALATSIAVHVASVEKMPVALFSIEMSAEQMAMRVASSISGISGNRLRLGQLDADEWVQYADAVQRMQNVPLVIDGDCATVPEIRASTRRIVQEVGPLSLIIIDHLHELSYVGKAQNRTQEVGEMAKACKRIGKEFRVPVILLSQLNRSAEGNEPTLADLRESGDIEAVADVVVFLHRQRWNGEGQRPTVEPTKINFAKHRNGQTGPAMIGFRSEAAKYVNIELNGDEPTGF